MPHNKENCIKIIFNIAFVSPLSCSKLPVTWTRAMVAFLIFFCRFLSRKSAFFCELLSCKNTLFLSGTDNFGQFSGARRSFDASFNWSRVNFVCHFNSVFIARLPEIFWAGLVAYIYFQANIPGG